MSKVLIIGDTHFPACHSKYLEFVSKIYHKYSCNNVIHIGDVVDHHAISFHKKHPDAQDATAEYKKSGNFKTAQQYLDIQPGDIMWLDYLSSEYTPRGVPDHATIVEKVSKKPNTRFFI